MVSDIRVSKTVGNTLSQESCRSIENLVLVTIGPQSFYNIIAGDEMEHKKMILIAEDNRTLSEALKIFFEAVGYGAIVVRSNRELEQVLLTSTIDLILLDKSLVDGDSARFLPKIKHLISEKPIIVTTANHTEEAAVEFFDLGVVDFVRKPFGNLELLKRIENRLGRVEKEKNPTLDFTLDVVMNVIVGPSSNVKCTSLESKTLHLLITSPTRIWTRDRLLELLGASEDNSDRSIDTLISKIRRKLRLAGVQSVKIKSRYGQGYAVEIS